MPNRMLYTGLLTSKRVNSLTPDAFELYIRLLLVVDDYGRYSGSPTRIARSCWLDNEEKTGPKITPTLKLIVKAGLLLEYKVDGEMYIQITKWNQRTRAAESKYPPSPDNCQLDDGQMTVNCQTDDGSRVYDVDVDVDVDVIRKGAKQKHKYGEYKNVLLTDEELEKLKSKYPDYEAKIENFSEGIKLKDYGYTCHYLAILKWAKNETGTHSYEAKLIQSSTGGGFQM